MDTNSDNYYDYNPSKGAAIIFAILYTATFICTTLQYIVFKSWFWIFMVLAATMDAIGYIARVFSAYEVDNKTAFIIQFILIFLAPALMAASCYMAMGRIVIHATPISARTIKNLWIPPRWMTPVFVTCDIIAFFIQIIGAVKATGDDPSSAKDGYNIMKGGLAIQLVCFGFFLVISFRFHFVCERFHDSWPDSQWKKLLVAINISSTLIFVRSIFRMIEFVQGQDGYLMTHEWPFYVFEAATMLPILVLFNVYHPARFLTNVGWKQQKEKSHLPLDESILHDIDAQKK